jgi:hypothetical protein
MLKQKFIWWLVVSILITYIAIFVILKPKTIKADNGLLELAPAVVLAEQNSQNTKLVRTSDGSPQDLPGRWEVTHSRQGHTMAFQEKSVYFFTGEKVNTIELTSIATAIESIQVSPKGTYIAVTSSKEGEGSYFCFTEMVTTSKQYACSTVNVLGTNAEGRWNPENVEQFVIKKTDGQMETIEMNNIKPRGIEKKSEEYERLDKLFTSPEPQLIKFGHLIFAQTDEGLRIMSTPLSAEVHWIIPGKIFSSFRKNTLTLMDAEARRGYEIKIQTPAQ